VPPEVPKFHNLFLLQNTILNEYYNRMVIHSGVSLRQIECFLAVAEAGTVSAAARMRHVSQPALSKTINDLERLLDARLFDRAGRKMVLTPAGQVLRRYGISAIASLETGLGAASGRGRQDRISVGILPTVAGNLFPEVALAFSRSHPEVSVSISTGPNRYLLDLLRSGEIDLMVGRMPTVEDMPDLRFEYLYEDRIELVGRYDHPGHSLPVEQCLRSFPLMLPSRGAIIRERVDTFLTMVGLSDVRPTFESVSPSFALPILQRSSLLWFISRGVVAGEIERKTIKPFRFYVRRRRAYQPVCQGTVTVSFNPHQPTA